MSLALLLHILLRLEVRSEPKGRANIVDKWPSNDSRIIAQWYGKRYLDEMHPTITTVRLSAICMSNVAAATHLMSAYLGCDAAPCLEKSAHNMSGF